MRRRQDALLRRAPFARCWALSCCVGVAACRWCWRRAAGGVVGAMPFAAGIAGGSVSGGARRGFAARVGGIASCRRGSLCLF
jgi:hypothetical protein